MKSKVIICALTVASLGFGSVSFAQDYGRRGPGDEPRRVEQRGDQRGFQQREAGDAASRDFDRRDARNDREFGARGPQFHRGGHIPREYRSHQYVVDNWRDHHLSPPPRGHQWVQVGADYALIAIATGVIAQLVLSH